MPPEAPEMGDLNMNLSLIKGGPWPAWSACLTKNKLCGAPITYIRGMMKEKSTLKAVLVNNKISNVCAKNGLAATSELASFVDGKIEGDGQTLPASTGIIGWTLPVDEIKDGISKLMESADVPPVELASSIMTTDRYPKLRSATVGDAKIVGLAKGAGMIEPNMGTMLCYIMTDADISGPDLDEALKEAVEESFNCVSVDGDESTSDMVVGIASGLSGSVDLNDFRLKLREVCAGLSQDIVRNGEGTSHVIEVRARNFPGRDSKDARDLCKAVVNSPLIKCAIAGNDPNIGRIASAVGSFMGKWQEGRRGGDFDTKDLETDWTTKCTIKIGDRIVFLGGEFQLDGEAESALSDYIKSRSFGNDTEWPENYENVVITVDFGTSSGTQATVWGSDLTKEYVAVNADYRS